MKRLKKSFITGLAVLLLTACTEDVLTEQPSDHNTTTEQTPNTGALARATKDATELHATFASNNGESWNEGDSVWIFTLNSMRYNSYLLSQGAGSRNGIFTRTHGSNNYTSPETLYAITSGKYFYSFSATQEGGAQLTVTIPRQYTIEETGAQEGCSRMPAPYWGIATFGTDGKLQASFQGLTALLKVDLTTLPADTRAIVLTTHSYAVLNKKVLDGSYGEPLSGTLDTELTEGAKLASNPIFWAYDSLRVNLAPKEDTEQEYRYAYIPVVAETYLNLNVIAVTGDSRNAYEWEGKLLKTYKSNFPFKPNTIVALEPESTGIKTPRM